jgi:hypothetical protein
MKNRYLILTFIVPLLAASVIAQEKPEWTAVPGAIFQQNKSYPTSAAVRLFRNDCYDSSGNIVKPLDTSVQYDVAATGVGLGIKADQPGTPGCSITLTLSISGAVQPGIQALSVKKAKGDYGYAQFIFMDATAGPTPSTPEVDVMWEVLTDHVCRDNFGNHMPGDLYCIEAKIGNNSGHAL